MKHLTVPKWVNMLLLIFVVWICYANAIQGPFLWDDEVMVSGNPLIKNWSNIKTIFTTSAFGDQLQSSKFYRPIQILTYLFDYKMWGLTPSGFHVTSIIIHTLNTLVLYLLVFAMGFRITIALLAGLLFAVHPMNIESVTYISGRGDVLFLLFVLLSFLTFIKGWKGKFLWFIPSVLFYVLSLMTKENAVPLPLIVLAWTLLIPKEKKHGSRWAWLSLGMLNGVMLLYTAYRLTGMESKLGTLSLIAHASFWERCLTVPKIVFTYLKLIVFPYPLHMEYHFVTRSLMYPSVWFGIPFLLLLAFLIWTFFFKRGVSHISTPELKKAFDFSDPFAEPNYGRRLFFFLLFWFVVALGPVLNVLVPLAATLREHWLSFPGISLILGISIGLIHGYQKSDKKWVKELYLGVMVLAVVLLASATVYRNWDWQEPLRLYEHDVKYEPNSFLLYNNIGVEYYRRNDHEKAKKAFFKAIKVSPKSGYGVAHNNYGVVLENEGEIPTAIHYYASSVKLENYELAYSNLGRLYLSLGKVIEAILILEEGRKHHPRQPDILFFLGAGHMQANNKEKAIEAFSTLAKYFGNYKQCYSFLEDLQK